MDANLLPEFEFPYFAAEYLGSKDILKTGYENL